MNEEKFKHLLKTGNFSSGADIQLMPGAGSDRNFFRVRDRGRSAIIMSGAGHGAAIEDWVEIEKFLSELGFGVPRIFAYNPSIPAVLIEDLGEMSRLSPADYRLIVPELARLAVIAGRKITRCPVVADRPFDRKAFRWESRYFTEEFLIGYRKISREKIEPMLEKFDRIAGKLAELPKAFCHRDFQSSNVSVADGKVRIIDFQSAKYGPLEYDLASLLWDPYAELSAKFREELIDIYLQALGKLEAPIDSAEFRKNLEIAAISRLMQALGAYCFLSRAKGKSDFEKYIQPAERRFLSLLRKSGENREFFSLLRSAVGQD